MGLLWSKDRRGRWLSRQDRTLDLGYEGDRKSLACWAEEGLELAFSSQLFPLVHLMGLLTGAVISPMVLESSPGCCCLLHLHDHYPIEIRWPAGWAG